MMDDYDNYDFLPPDFTGGSGPSSPYIDNTGGPNAYDTGPPPSGTGGSEGFEGASGTAPDGSTSPPPAGVDPGVWSTIKGIAASMGITSMKDIMGLATLLAPALGALYSNSKTKQAGTQMTDAINNANKTLTDAFTGAGKSMQPYSDAGLAALAKAPGMMFQPTNIGPVGGGGPLAGKYQPISAGAPVAPQFKPLGAGRGMTLGDFAKGR